jgi:hypothetical protein
LKHVKDVKVHTTYLLPEKASTNYFLPVEASTKAWVYFFSITTIFLCTFIAVPSTTYWIQTLRLLLCLSHASIKRKRPTYGGTLLGSSLVKPATEHSSCLLALHMFVNHLYMCADWWHCYIQSLGLEEHPLDKSLLADVCERISTFLMEQVITVGGNFFADAAVWAEIMYGD